MRKRETTGWRQAIDEGRWWTEADARAVLAESERSGESVAVFAQRNGVDPRRLYRWRRRLEEPVERSRLAPLIPVTVGGARHTEAGAGDVAVIDGELRVEVSDASKVAPEWVAELLRRVREGRQ